MDSYVLSGLFASVLQRGSIHGQSISEGLSRVYLEESRGASLADGRGGRIRVSLGTERPLENLHTVPNGNAKVL